MHPNHDICSFVIQPNMIDAFMDQCRKHDYHIEEITPCEKNLKVTIHKVKRIVPCKIQFLSQMQPST